METRKPGIKKHSFTFITDINDHAANMEAAFKLPPNHIAILFSDTLLNDFKSKLDALLQDFTNVEKKQSENALRFVMPENEEVSAYIRQSQVEINKEVQLSLADLRIKHDALIAEFEKEIAAARTAIRGIEDVNEARLLTNLKLKLIEAIQQSPHVGDAHALDHKQDHSLDFFQKTIHHLLKEAKHGKKQIVHDIKKSLQDNEACKKLIFPDKHDFNFKPIAYSMEEKTFHARNTALNIMKSLKTSAESKLHHFEYAIFRGDHFQRISRSSSRVTYGLQAVRAASVRKLDTTDTENDAPKNSRRLF